MKIVLPENMFFSVQGVRFMTLRDIEIYKEGQRFHSVKEYLAYLQYKHSIVQMPLSKPRTHEPAYLNYGVVPTAQEMEIVQSVYGSRYWSWMTVPVREALAIHYRFGGVLESRGNIPRELKARPETISRIMRIVDDCSLMYETLKEEENEPWCETTHDGIRTRGLERIVGCEFEIKSKTLESRHVLRTVLERVAVSGLAGINSHSFTVPRLLIRPDGCANHKVTFIRNVFNADGNVILVNVE